MSKNNDKNEDIDQEDDLLKKWEYNLIFSLMVLLIMATILDLKVPIDKILKIILH